MAKRKIESVTKISSKEETKNGIFSKLKITDSYASLILGVIVVLVVGILFFAFVRGNRDTQTTSSTEAPESDATETDDSNISSTYTIKPGDDLWSISLNVYNDGYKWVEIAKLNKLENPGLIHAGNKLNIPSVDQKELSKTQNSLIENNSITGNTYTIKSGDNLWDIAVRAYGDGFKWTEIAKANNLSNPDLIFSDNMLKLPR